MRATRGFSNAARGLGTRGGRGGATPGGRGVVAPPAPTGGITCYVCGVNGHLGDTCPNRDKMVDPDLASAATKVTPLDCGGQITELYGDLMTSPDSLCHCVSACLAMGKGIAVLFKQAFGRVDELKAQKVGVGGVAVLDAGPRFIYYLITKPRYFDKPTYDTLAASLVCMREHMTATGTKAISMPELGCGLDGLEWPQVHALLRQVFEGSGIHITVYHFKPATQMWAKKANYASR